MGSRARSRGSNAFPTSRHLSKTFWRGSAICVLKRVSANLQVIQNRCFLKTWAMAMLNPTHYPGYRYGYSSGLRSSDPKPMRWLSALWTLVYLCVSLRKELETPCRAESCQSLESRAVHAAGGSWCNLLLRRILYQHSNSNPGVSTSVAVKVAPA